MDAETYIEQARTQGINIPRSLRPDKNGKIDIAKIPEAKRLISHLLDSGGFAEIREQDGVEPNLLPCILISVLNCKNELFSSLWKNHSGRKIKTVVFVDFEQKAKVYSEKLNLLQTGSFSEGNDLCLYKARFLQETQEKSISIFKSVIMEERPRVVLFDCSINIKNSKLLEIAINYCLQKNIAVIAIVKEAGLLHNQEDIAKIVNVWNSAERYIIETVKRTGEKAVPPFSLYIAGELKFVEESPKVLDELPDRKNVQYNSGVDSDLQKDFYTL